MNWTEQQTKTRETITVSEAKAKLFEEVKKDLPVVQKEADAGVRPFATVHLQPIKGVGTFEAEFGVKGDDVIFHFWPWGYHDAERQELRTPSFKSNFFDLLTNAILLTFKNVKPTVVFDGDIGAWFVLIPGAAGSQFHRELCIEAATNLHKIMGGEV